MQIISGEQKELIDAVLAEGLASNLSAAIFEKDIHVTDALHALLAVDHPHVKFVFCGGTSLSKAHRVIERMSEDVDIKVVLRPDHGLSSNQLKKHLSKLKNTVNSTMLELGFDAIDCERIALNENRYFASGWRYQSRYAGHASLRPHLSLEFTVRTPLSIHSKGRLVICSISGVSTGMSALKSPAWRSKKHLRKKYCRS